MKQLLILLLGLITFQVAAQSGKIIGGAPPRYITRVAVKPDITLYASNNTEADLSALGDSLGGRGTVTLVITKGASAVNPSLPAITDTLLDTKIKIKVYASTGVAGVFQADDGFVQGWDGTNFVPEAVPIIQIANTEEYTLWPVIDGSLKYWAYTKTSGTADGNGLISALPLADVAINAPSSKLTLSIAELRQDGKFYVGTDSSFIHDPVQDSTLFKGSLAILNGENGIKINKTGNPSFPSTNIPAIISGRYDPEWKANYYFNPFGYFDIETINNYQADPRFTFRHARGVNTRMRLSVGTGVGNIFFSPYDGTEYYQGALIGSYVQANSANGKFSQAIIMSIDKSGGQPQISNNWKFHLDTSRLTILTNFNVGGNLLGVGSKLKVIQTGFTGVNEDNPLAQLHVSGDCIITSTLWRNSSKTVGSFSGTGSPEGVVTASMGSTFQRTDVGLTYVKSTGTGNTGWLQTVIAPRKDTTVYIDNADLDWTSAITTEKIGRLYHTVTFWMTTTAAAGSNSDLTLPVPDINLMQTRFEVHSVDEVGGFTNEIKFGANNAVDSTNGLVGAYTPAAGQLVVIKPGLRSGVYKYRYSNVL